MKQLKRIFSGNPVFVTVFAVLCIVVFQFWWLRGDYREKKEQLLYEIENKVNSVVLNENLRETNRYIEGVKATKFFGELSDVLEKNLSNGTEKPIITIHATESDFPVEDTADKREILEKLGVDLLKKETIPPGIYSKQLQAKIDSALRPLHISYSFHLPSKNRFSEDDYIVSETPLVQNSEHCGVQLYGSFGTIAGRMVPSGLLSLLYLSVCLGAIILLNRNLRQTRNLLLLKRNFTNNMTHELKTPLATIYAATESLDRYNGRQDPETAKEYLGFIRGELDRLNKLIDTILLQAQLENDKILLHSERMRFGKLVNRSVQHMQPRLDEQQALLDYRNVPQDVFVCGDANHLTNVLTNLIDNALKYTNGRPEITLSAQVSGNDLKIVFSDNGIGIPEKHLRHIFDPYYRVPEKDNDLHSVKGYGLGLHYVQQVVQLHGGTIKVASGIGKGTTFTITLPLSHE